MNDCHSQSIAPPLDYPVPIHTTWSVIDNSKLDHFRRCPRRFFYRYVMGWRSRGLSKDLVWGEGMHRMFGHCVAHGWDDDTKAMAVQLATDYYRETFGPEDDANNLPKIPAAFETALKDYCRVHGTEDSNYTTLGLEIGFRMVVKGFSISGRMDWVIQDNTTREILFMDWKSGSKLPDARGINQWQLDNQMATYITALKRKYPEHLVERGIISLIVPYRPDYKTGKPKPTGLRRIPVIQTPQWLERWQERVKRVMLEVRDEFMQLALPDPYDASFAFPPRETACYDYFRLCPYFDQCASWPNLFDALEEGIPDGMVQKFWDPTAEKASEIWQLT